MMKININLMVLALLAVCISSCGGDDDKKNNPQDGTLDKTSITLYVDETSFLTYSGGQCVWTSDNDLIAKVENGTVTGNHVGETTIHANDAMCKVTVLSKINSYTEPLMLWGANQTTIKSKMSSYTLKSSDTSSLIYTGKGRVLRYGYFFENGGLKTSAMTTSLSYSSNVTDFLLDRYITFIVEEDKHSVGLISPDWKIMVIMVVETSGILISYQEYTPTKVSDLDFTIDSIREQMHFPSDGEKLSDSEVSAIFNRFSMAMK